MTVGTFMGEAPGMATAFARVRGGGLDRRRLSMLSMLIGLVFALFGGIAPEAEAGTKFNITIVNNSSNTLYPTITSQDNWYPNGSDNNLAGFMNAAATPANGKKTYNTEECSAAFGCATSSSLEVCLAGAKDPMGPCNVRIYLKGNRGGFPDNWVPVSKSELSDGGVAIGNVLTDDSTAVVGTDSLACVEPGNNNVINCTITVSPGLFSTTSDKYKTDDATLNARRYWENGVLRSDGVVFNADTVTNLTVKFDGTTLTYPKYDAGLFSPATPDCSKSSMTGTVLYVVLKDWSLVVLPVCDERVVFKLPLLYSMSSTGGVMPIDVKLPFSQIVQNNQIMITHGGLSGAVQVRAAGEMKISSKGSLMSINNDSGHYSPTAAALYAAVTYFRSQKASQAAFTLSEPVCNDKGVCTYSSTGN